MTYCRCPRCGALLGTDDKLAGKPEAGPNCHQNKEIPAEQRVHQAERFLREGQKAVKGRRATQTRRASREAIACLSPRAVLGYLSWASWTAGHQPAPSHCSVIAWNGLPGSLELPSPLLLQ